jgi:hypothetical protein
MHTLAEQHEWLTRWVVNKEKKPDPPEVKKDKGKGNGKGSVTKMDPNKALLWLAAASAVVFLARKQGAI